MTGEAGAAPGFPAGPWLEELVAAALREDVGSGDATTAIAVDPGALATGCLRARQDGVVAGLPLAARVWNGLSAAVMFTPVVPDGTAVAGGQVVARVSGPAAAVLTGERLALNFVQHLSGIATLTARYVAAVAGTGCRVLDTRKTVPGYRLLAKYAVRCGGGANHRLGLYDRILLKDNHWAAGEPLEAMVARARRLYPALPVEVEVDTADQLARVLPLGVEWIMLDNFTVDGVVSAVAARDAVGSTALLEVSGNVTLETIAAYARAGADAASVGRLTHSAPALDLGLDLECA
ncbi:MAG: carboxylating nicotinate-nucleotide diphosphorylase [bacterium]|nr:carboxylating nicotinate-nucleotide diphosphorylase [bacterium]